MGVGAGSTRNLGSWVEVRGSSEEVGVTDSSVEGGLWKRTLPAGPRGGAVLNTKQGFTYPPVLTHLFLTQETAPGQLWPAHLHGPTVTGVRTCWPLHRTEGPLPRGDSGLRDTFGLTVHSVFLGYTHFFRTAWVGADPCIFLWKSISIMTDAMRLIKS